ncbi:MAG: DUF975 family protein [Lachnospiraceae bacterium]|nr:DUF975 family protein [Lachnospiraceae bacterium]
MNITMDALMKETKEPLRRAYWKITVTTVILMMLAAAVSYSALVGTINEIPGLFQRVIANEFSGERTLDFRMVAVVLTMVGGMLMLSLIIKLFLNIFLENPLLVGADKMMLSALEPGEPVVLASLAHAFDSDYLNSVKVMFLKRLFRDLWMLCLIVPGIIKGYEYMLIPYLLAENPYQTWHEVFAKSKQMMKGYKKKAFLIDLYFIPWSILGLLTMGILTVFYIEPKKTLVKADFYLKVKSMYEGENE